MGRGPLTQAQIERFERLAWPCMDQVLRAAQVLTRHHAEAEDLAQETLIKAMRAIDTFREGTDMRAWLLTILRRTHIDRLRAGRTRIAAEVSVDAGTLAESVAADESAPAGDRDGQWENPQELMRRFDDEQMLDAMSDLPDEIRWTLLLVDVEQMDHADAAAVLNVPVGTIKSRAHRGRAMLRDRLYDMAARRGWVQPADAASRSQP